MPEPELMSYFCKAKFPAQVVDGIAVTPVEKKRVLTASAAYAWADAAWDRGAMSITIRLENDREDN